MDPSRIVAFLLGLLGLAILAAVLYDASSITRLLGVERTLSEATVALTLLALAATCFTGTILLAPRGRAHAR